MIGRMVLTDSPSSGERDNGQCHADLNLADAEELSLTGLRPVTFTREEFGDAERMRTAWSGDFVDLECQSAVVIRYSW